MNKTNPDNSVSPVRFVLCSPCGRNQTSFRSLEEGIEVEGIEMDEGDGESGPSCEPIAPDLLQRFEAVRIWNKLIADGWRLA